MKNYFGINRIFYIKDKTKVTDETNVFDKIKGD